MSPTATPGRSFFDRPYLLLTLTSLFWAINIVLGRFIAGQVPPVVLSQIRWTGAALIVLPLAWPHLKRDWPALRDSLGIMLLLSFMGITVYNTLAYHALEYTEAINGLLVQSATPLMIALWSLVLFRDRLTGAQLLGIVMSLTGVVTIIARGDLTSLLGLTINRGDFWFLVALFCYALYAALLRKRPRVHFLAFLAFTLIAGGIMLLPATIAEFISGRRIQPSPAAFAVMGYIVVFPSAIAYIFFNRGVELIGANRAGPFFHLIPLFGAAIAILFLGERPQFFHLVGYALIIAGIVVVQVGARKAPT